MSDQQSDNQPVAEGADGYNVIAVSFEDDRNAYRALTVLKDLDAQRRIGLQEAVIVARGEDGHVVEKERFEAESLPATWGGGFIGLLVGIIGGPLGILIGSSGGLFLGSMFDLDEMDETDSALEGISSAVRVGRTSLLAVVTEQSPELVDAAMSGLGGTVLRRPADDVEAEMAAAEKAERNAKREARKELGRSHPEHDKAAVNAKLDELKGKLRRGSKAPA